MTPPESTNGEAARPVKQENLWINLLCNVAVPSLILMKLSAPERLGPVWSLAIALSFPIGYSIYDFVAFRTWSMFSVVGFGSTLLTGGLGLFEVAAFWIAVKEAAVPAVFGVAVIGSLWTATPLVRTLLLNEKLVDVPRVRAALRERGVQAGFDGLVKRATLMLAGSFFLSAVTNFGLARVVLRSPPDSPEFKAEMGRMLAWSWPVNVLPGLLAMLLILWYLLAGIKRLTGLTLDDVFHDPAKAAPAKPTER